MADKDVTRRIERGGRTKKSGNAGIIVFLLAVIIIMAFLTIIVVTLRGKNDVSAEKRNVVVNAENVEEILASLSEQDVNEPGYYEVTMNSEWVFEDGKSISENAYVENAVTNTNDVYFDVNLKDTNELIYSSPILPLGSHIENITLDKELAAGTYDCIMTYHLVDENQETVSTLKITLTIEIQN
ncbi:MAG: hypothetical protein NC081_02735 [Roseburia sp.]|nr:hypothetical protein [Roseburia sp.]